MRFQLTADAKPGNDIEKFNVTFTAPTWSDANKWAVNFIKQIGFKPQGDLEWMIILAPIAETPVSDFRVRHGAKA